MIFEVKTKYTKESYRKFQWFHLARGGARKVVFIVSLAVMFLAGALLLLTSIFFEADLSVTVFLALFFFLLPIFYILIPRINANSVYKKSPALFDTGLSFTFQEDYFTVLTTGMISGTSEIRYEALFRAYQTKDSFYLYLQQQQSYIIDKASFTTGTPEDFALFLAKVMPAKKYRSYI